MKPTFEQLESRNTPTQVFVNGTVLTVIGDNTNERIAIVSDGQGNTAVDLGWDGFNDFAVPTAGLSAVVVLGNGGDDFIGSQPGQNLPAGLDGGPGNDNITSFTTGTISGGNGNDQIYQIVTQVKIDGGNGQDRLVVSVQAVTDGDPNDDTQVNFGQPQGQAFQVLGRVGYFQATAGDDQGFVTRRGRTLFVTYNGQDFTVNNADIDVFAGVTGNGNDTIILARNVNQRLVAYGGAGQDTFKAGRGDSLLKGGAGNDVIIGSPTGRNDLSGANGQIDLAARDYIEGGAAVDVIRTDANDILAIQRRRDITLNILQAIYSDGFFNRKRGVFQ